uniref:Ankyrin repeat and fibronectin type-III domain-containing protein 1 n=1 Tax=Timema monikensis TaxID=170555 RepID=A0A7R9HQT0_9NEOP|nr:unnamed protein product [Timema monikensis]
MMDEWKVKRQIAESQEGGMEFLVDGLNLNKNTKKKLDKVNRINIHLHALFAAVEHGHVDRARTILESTDVDVNSVNSDGLSPLDMAVLNNNRQLAKMLVAFGAQEGNQSVTNKPMPGPHTCNSVSCLRRTVKSPESLGTHLKQLLGEAERKVQELGGGLLPVDESSPVNHNNNNRTSFSIIGPPDVPFLVAVDVTGTNSVTVRFQEPEQQDSAICTKFKVQWSLNDNFSPLAGEKEILDMKHLEYQVTDLQQGHRYFFRVAAGNLKGYGQFRPSTPTSVMPSSWRDMEGREPRYAGRLRLLDDLFDEIRSSRPEHASEIKASLQLGETPGVQRRNQKKKTTIKQLFTVASKFQKNLRRGVFLACLLYHEDKVLVTNEDFLPVIEVDETYPSCIYNDFHWLMKVACTWDDVKSLRQDMEKSLSSSTVHFRIKLLQAAAQMQTALCIQDLGQLYHRPIRDSQGTLVISTVNYVRSPKTVSVLNSRWIPLSKVQKKLIGHEELNVGDLLMSSIQEQITYHQVSSIRLNRGLYLGYLKMRSSVDLIQVVVPCKTPNVLPHCKIRDNPHVSSEEWEWLKWQAARHKPLTDESCAPEEEEGADQQRVFVELVAATARRLFSYMEVSNQDALAHRLYNTEVVDLSPEVSFLIIVPPAESACAAPGQTDLLLQRGDLVSLPVQVFEMVHLGTYQREVISRYSRLSCILELDTVLAHHSHREAFSSSEVAAAKDRLSQLQEFQGQLNSTWKGVRWLMDVLTFARDRTVTTPGVSMKQLLSLTTTTSGTDKSASSSLKRSLLQLPPRDPKLVKSSASRGSWPGPGAHPGGVACLLGAELSKSEQHLSGRGGSRKNSGGGSSVGSGTSQYQGHSDMSGATSTALMTTSASNGSLSSADVASRLPPSRSEDMLLQRPHTKCHARSRSSTLSPLMSVRGAGGPSYPTASMVSVTPNTSASMHSLSSDESSSAAAPLTTTDEREDVSVPTPTSGILQVYAAYETGLASGTSLKLHVTPRTTAREVVDLVVKQLNMAVILKGKDGPMYSSEKLANFCLVAIIGARERCLRDDFKPLQLQDPWKKGRLYVRQKQDKLAALEQCSRHTAYL